MDELWTMSGQVLVPNTDDLHENLSGFGRFSEIGIKICVSISESHKQNHNAY